MGTLHHLQVGCADASVIKTANYTFLVDCHNIGDFENLLPASKSLHAVFITHQHRDHFSGLQYLRENGYSIIHLVFAPYERRRNDASVELDEWNEFEGHRVFFEQRGTKIYRPFRQEKWDKPWWNIDGASFWMIGPHQAIAQSETRELHDACLVMKVHFDERKCLFAGDASDTALAEIANSTKNFCDDILHASHHGSINGAEESFVKKCNAHWTVISTAEDVHDSIPHPDAIKLYQRHTAQTVYRTDKDGTLKWDV